LQPPIDGAHKFEQFGTMTGATTEVEIGQRYSIGEQTHRLLRLINTLTAEDMENRLEFLSGWRAF
jgi:hypothetical protein